MNRTVISLLAGAALAASAWGVSLLQGAPDVAARLRAQREALDPFAMLDGEWRGDAWTLKPDGSRHELTQTERIGPMLDGSVRVIEGRGYESDGSVGFNALAILSFDPDKKALSMRSYAQGRSGDFPVKLTSGGFQWEMPVGPATIRYSVTIEGDSWHEIGEYLVPGQEPRPILEMTLTRLGDCAWPAAGAVGAK